jgi:hypothetical protein
MTHIFDIIICLFTALVSACSVQFYDFCIGEPTPDGKVVSGRIFSRIGRYIADKYIAHEIRYPDRLNFWKAAGICPPCTSVYISVVVFAFAWLFLDLHPLYFLPVAVISMRLTRAWS